MTGKGSRQRPTDRTKYEKNYSDAFKRQDIECPHCQVNTLYQNESALDCEHCGKQIVVHRFWDGTVIVNNG